MARIFSLLKLFGLENRLVQSADEVDSLPDINWELTVTKLTKLKSNSQRFLNKAIVIPLK